MQLRTDININEIKWMYCIQGFYAWEIAKEFNCDKRTILNRLEKANIPRRPQTRYKLGNEHPKWKGGRVKMGGYVFILNPSHPRAVAKRYVREHIVIAEKALGKPLPSQAEIHHYGKRDDNSKIVICENHGYHKFLEGRTRIIQDKKLGGKVCSRCEIRKSFNEFHKVKREFDGLSNSCKECKKESNHNFYIKKKGR